MLLSIVFPGTHFVSDGLVCPFAKQAAHILLPSASIKALSKCSGFFAIWHDIPHMFVNAHHVKRADACLDTMKLKSMPFFNVFHVPYM